MILRASNCKFRYKNCLNIHSKAYEEWLLKSENIKRMFVWFCHSLRVPMLENHYSTGKKEIYNHPVVIQWYDKLSQQKEATWWILMMTEDLLVEDQGTINNISSAISSLDEDH